MSVTSNAILPNQRHRLLSRPVLSLFLSEAIPAVVLPLTVLPSPITMFSSHLVAQRHPRKWHLVCNVATLCEIELHLKSVKNIEKIAKVSSAF